MNTAETSNKCPLCGRQLEENIKVFMQDNIAKYLCNCSQCGKYIYNGFILRDSNFPSIRHLVSAWVRRQNKIGIEYPEIGSSSDSAGEWFRKLKYMGFPETVNEKWDALLRAYTEVIKKDYENKYDATIKSPLYPFLIAEIAANNLDEIIGLNKILSQLGYVEIEQGGDHIRVLAKGWQHISELSKIEKSGDNAFIAMWYDQCTDAYRDSVIAAVKRCGYKPSILDQHEFNGFIMEQAVSLIRQSRFLIADFTSRPETNKTSKKVNGGVRGGVYWEAGLAYGMGKPVIQTCENSEEAKERIHFDIEQYNTIFWESKKLSTDIRDLSVSMSNPNFAERVALRILSTIGRGNIL